MFFLFTGVFSNILIFLTKKELVEDSTDFIVNYIVNFLPSLSIHAQLFIVFYLLSQGVIKIFLVINLIYNKTWAYLITMVFLEIFIIYQIYRFICYPSIFLTILTLFDVILMYLA